MLWLSGFWDWIEARSRNNNRKRQRMKSSRTKSQKKNSQFRKKNSKTDRNLQYHAYQYTAQRIIGPTGLYFGDAVCRNYPQVDQVQVGVF